MSDAASMPTARIAVELDRLSQEVSATKHVLEDDGARNQEEMVRRLRHIAVRATRIAAMVENATLV